MSGPVRVRDAVLADVDVILDANVAMAMEGEGKVLATFPHAQVTRFSGAGHWPHEEEPAAFIAALRSSLACAHPV
jgi:pimeloyl-ACP methyl ester carboxylesterase